METLKPCELPAGRLLYRPAEEARHVVVNRGRPDELWVVEDGWTEDSRAAGPFRPEDILRALRLANTSVPEGCERGPWQAGIGLFRRAVLPAPAGDWSRVDAAWLLPSVSRYSGSEGDKLVNETCCAPSAERPRIHWDDAKVAVVRSDTIALVRARCEGLRPRHSGTLSKAWNAHPAGSIVLAESTELSEGFAIVDLPD